jgi:hypothetical protein
MECEQALDNRLLFSVGITSVDLSAHATRRLASDGSRLCYQSMAALSSTTSAASFKACNRSAGPMSELDHSRRKLSGATHTHVRSAANWHSFDQLVGAAGQEQRDGPAIFNCDVSTLNVPGFVYALSECRHP